MNQPPPPENMPWNTIVPFSTTAFYPEKPIQVTFLSLELLSLTLTLTLAMTIAFARSVKRHPFIITYLLLSAFYSASTVISLIPAGGYITQLPILPLAIVQAGVSFAGGTVAAYSDMLLASLMFFKIMPVHSRLAKFGDSRRYSLFILISPWCLFVGISFIGMSLIMMDNTKVQHQGLICFLAIPRLLDLYYITTLTFFACTTIIDFIMASCLIRYHFQRPFSTSSPEESCSIDMPVSDENVNVSSGFNDTTFSSSSLPDTPMRKSLSDRKASVATISMNPLKRMNKNIGLAVRVAALGGFFLINMILHILIVARKLSAGPVLLYSANRGTIIFLILASQPDILNHYLTSLNTFLFDLRDIFYLLFDSLSRLLRRIPIRVRFPFTVRKRPSNNSLSSGKQNIRSHTPALTLSNNSLAQTKSRGSSSSSVGQEVMQQEGGIVLPVMTSFHQKRAFEEYDGGEKGPLDFDEDGLDDQEKARFGTPTNSGVMVSVEVEVFSEECSDSSASSSASPSSSLSHRDRL